MATQIRLAQLTGSVGSGTGQINDATAGAAGAAIAAGDLSTILSHMASAIKRINGASTFSEATASTLLVSDGANRDLILDQNDTGQKIYLDSEGTGANAVQVDSAGGIDLNASDMITLDAADEITLTTTSADGHISLVTAHTSGVAFHIDANADAASEVQIDAGILDVDVTGAATMDAGGSITLTGAGVLLAGGSSEVDITTSGAFDVNVGSVDLDSSAGIAMDGTTVSIDGTDDSNLTVTASGKDLDIAVAGGSTQELRLASAGTGASALHLNASAGGVDIDSADMITLDAADEITLTTTSADGHVSLVSAHTAGVAIHLDGDAAAGSIVDIDAGILDIDVTGVASLDSGGTLSLGTANSGVAVNIGHSTSEVTIGDNLVVTGNLTINGDTTTVSTTNLNVEDSLIVLQAENTSGSSTSDLGIIMERGSTGDNAALIWDEGADKFLFGTTTETGADSDVTVSVGTVQVGKLEIDGTGDSIDVDTDLKIISSADILLDPTGGEVKVDGNLIPNSDSDDSLGADAVSASHSAGSSASGLTSNLSSSQSFAMTSSGNVAVLYGSSLTAPSASSAPSGLESAVGSSVSLSSFSSTFNGTLTISNSYSGSSIAVGTVLSLNGSSSKFFFVVTSAYSGGSSMSICALPNISGHTTSIGSVSSISSYGGSFSGSGLSGVSASSGETVGYTFSGGTAIFVLAAAITSSTPWGFVGDPRDDLSTLSTFSSSGSPSAATAGGSVTAATSVVAWAKLFVDDIDLNGAGRIDLDADADTSVRASADDVITFEVGGSDLVDIKAAGLQITDDKKLMFGAASGGDASFEYDEDGNDVLLYAGAALRISDDVKIEFGSGGDAGIEYDEDGTDQLRIHQPAAGVVIAGTNPKLVLGDAGAEDTMMVFDGNAADFRIGLDDGTDKLEIGAGSAHGTTIGLGMDASGHVTQIGQSTHTNGLYLQWDGSKAVFATVAPTIYRHTLTTSDISTSSQSFTMVGSSHSPSGSSAVAFGGSGGSIAKVFVYLNGQLQLLGASGASGTDVNLTSTGNQLTFAASGDLAAEDVLQVIVYA
mgnify:CR=1 FL=1